MKTRPLGNNVLVEIQREYAGVSRLDENESLTIGKVIGYNLAPYHLTASAARRFDPKDLVQIDTDLSSLVGKLVRWEEFAEGGQTFTEDGKTYALIPWWRLIAVTEVDDA